MTDLGYAVERGLWSGDETGLLWGFRRGVDARAGAPPASARARLA
jgi:hypothetical protein